MDIQVENVTAYNIFSLGATDVGVNPKINNIMQCYEHTKYQYIWICDSNIQGKCFICLSECLERHLNYYLVGVYVSLSNMSM